MGSSRPQHVDVRLIAATNVDLRRAVNENKFRDDLYYRLCVVQIHLPPLRERREEIPMFVDHYLKLYQAAEGKSDIELADGVMEYLTTYDWPGNVRELCNELIKLVALNSSGAVLTIDDLSPDILSRASEGHSAKDGSNRRVNYGLNDPRGASLASMKKESERKWIIEALCRNGGNVRRVAAELGMSYQALYKKLTRLKLRPNGSSSECTP